MKSFMKVVNMQKFAGFYSLAFKMLQGSHGMAITNVAIVCKDNNEILKFLRMISQLNFYFSF